MEREIPEVQEILLRDSKILRGQFPHPNLLTYWMELGHLWPAFEPDFPNILDCRSAGTPVSGPGPMRVVVDIAVPTAP